MFKQMATLVGIEVTDIEKNDAHTGGAQYVLKGCDSDLWTKVQEDSENLFQLMSRYNEGRKSSLQIQAWCADMWALYWNLLKRDKKVRIHRELDFCWPKNPLSRWYHTKILHNAGVMPDDRGLFCKGSFFKFDPFFLTFDKIEEQKCSIKYIEQIRKYEASMICKSLENLELQLPLKFDSKMPLAKRKEAQRKVITLLSEKLDEKGIEHHVEELSLHAAIALGVKSPCFNSPGGAKALKDWLDKILSAIGKDQGYSSKEIESSRQKMIHTEPFKTAFNPNQFT